MIIQHNMAAMNANRMLGNVTSAQSKSTEKLSSGYRINRAADDAAGLSISEKMRAQIRGLNQASTNAQDGISLIQTAEGGLNETHAILQRMRELAVQASNGTETNDDRKAVADEISQLQSEIDRISTDTEFNTMKLLDGSLDGGSGSTSAGPKFGIVSTTDNIASGVIVTSSVKGIKVSFNTDSNNKAGAETAIWSSDGKTLNLNLVQNTTYSQEQIDKLIANAKQDENAATGQVADVSVALYNGQITTGTDATKTTDGTEAGVRASGSNSSLSVGDAAASFTGANKIEITLNKYGKELNAATITFTFDAKDTETVDAKDPTYTKNNVKTPANDAGQYTFHLKAGKEYTEADIEQVLRKAGIDATVKLSSGGPDQPPKTLFANSGAVSAIALQLKSGAGVGSATAVFGKAGYEGITGAAGGMTLQIGANEGQTMTFGIKDMSTKSLGIDGSKVSISTQQNAQSSITLIDNAIKTVSKERGKMGAIQNRLEHTISNLDTSAENLQSAESRIRDVNMAKQMVEYSKNNILMQASQSMLAQANQSTQGVLSLLQ